MTVANSFDLWQKDAFFSAAEEVQESADVMESTYRMWIREKRDGSKPEDLVELSRELQTALGTAKWQLEEFERAVRLSHGHRSDDITASRHKQFVAAIESQILRVEAELSEAFNGDGRQPLQWVNLDEEERDDLALFLSGTSQIPQFVKDDFTAVKPPVKVSFGENPHKRKNSDLNSGATCSRGTSVEHELVTIKKKDEVIIDIEAKENPGTRNDAICQVDKTAGSRRTWSPPNFSALKIVIAHDDEHRDGATSSIEATPKEKGYKPLFWNQRCGEHARAKGSVNLFQVGGLHRHLQTPLHLQFSCSVQLTLALMLSIFLIGDVVPLILNVEQFENCHLVMADWLSCLGSWHIRSAFSCIFILITGGVILLLIKAKGAEFLSEVVKAS